MIILICSPRFIFKTHQKWDLWEQCGHFSFVTHHNTWNTNMSFSGTIMGWCFVLLAAKRDEGITTCGRLPRCVRSVWHCRARALFLNSAAPDTDKKYHGKLNVWEFPVLWHYDGISVHKWCSPFAQQTVNPWVKWSILLLNFRQYQTPTLVAFEKEGRGMIWRYIDRDAWTFIRHSGFTLTFTYGQELWVVTRGIWLWIPAAKMRFIHWVGRETERRKAVWRDTRFKLSILCIQRSWMMLFGRLVGMPAPYVCVPLNVHQPRLSERTAHGKPRTCSEACWGVG